MIPLTRIFQTFPGKAIHVKLLFGTLGHFKGPLKNPLTVTRFFEILTFGFAKQY